MTGGVNHLEISLWPGAVQVPGGFGGRCHVVATLHDDARNAGELVRIGNQLAFFQPAGMHKIVVFNARKSQRKLIGTVLDGTGRVGQQREGSAFPQAPGQRGGKLLGPVSAHQALAVGGHQITPLGQRNRRQKLLPQIGEQPRCALLVIPEQLGSAQGEDAAQHQLRDVRRVRLGIGQRQRGAPGTAKHQPAIKTSQAAQAFNVGHQIPGGVVLQRSMRARAAAAALVKQQHTIALGVKQPPVLR